jgi:hypothetical protein
MVLAACQSEQKTSVTPAAPALLAADGLVELTDKWGFDQMTVNMAKENASDFAAALDPSQTRKRESKFYAVNVQELSKVMSYYDSIPVKQGWAVENIASTAPIAGYWGKQFRKDGIDLLVMGQNAEKANAKKQVLIGITTLR